MSLSRQSSVMDPKLYETACVDVLVHHLQSLVEGKQPVSTYSSTAVRTFRKVDDTEEIFEDAYDALRQAGWDVWDLASGLQFHEVQVDALIHVSSMVFDETITLRTPFIAIPKPKPNHAALTSPPKPFEFKVSDQAIELPEDIEAGVYLNCYCVFEVTIDPSKYKEKLVQLEKNLTFLLCRARVIHSMDDLDVADIVRFAGIITSKSKSVNVSHLRKFLDKNHAHLPMLTRLWALERLYLGRVPATSDWMAKQLALVASVSDSLSTTSVLNEKLLDLKVQSAELDLKIKFENLEIAHQNRLKAEAESRKAQAEAQKAQAEAQKAQAESQTALIDGVDKLGKLITSSSVPPEYKQVIEKKIKEQLDKLVAHSL
ncbi:hypothetical protein HDV05_001112 [Chytridiales sp. JEL 0842]|nr:hypothetical protein HDV05_001112 [Chytridiales sp. JEL 0842]